ncbi:MAG: DUF2892 domain-containing protein [Acidiferrobacterales bacterium]
MLKNVGSVDQMIRIVLGVALLGLIYFIEGPWRWGVGLVGVVLIATALVRWCPIFATIGLNSNKSK